MKKITSIIGLFLLGILAFQTTYAAEFISPQGEDPNVTVGSADTHRNLYAAGANVTVNGNTAGDLVVAGSMVSIDGTVEDDLLAAGGTLLINNSVGGDARVAGGNITISGAITGDLIVGGGNITITEKSSIGGDLIIGGGNVVVNGPVRGVVRVGGGNVTLNSKVDGEIRAHVSEKLTFGSRADVQSKVFYKAPGEATLENGSNVPNREFSKIDKRELKRGFASILTAAFLLKVLAWIGAGWAWMHFRKRRVSEVTESVRQDPFANLGWGAATILLTIILAGLLFFILIGYYAAIILLVWLVLMVLLVNLVSALVAGELVLRYLNKPGEASVTWQVVVLGVVLWHIIGFIPVVGWIVKILLFLMVFGAVIRIMKSRLSTDL
jgi:hypothetical protein